MLHTDPDTRNMAIAKCKHLPIGILYSDALISKERHEIIEAKLRDLGYTHQELRDRYDQQANIILELDKDYADLRHLADEEEIESKNYYIKQAENKLIQVNERIYELKKSTHKRRRELVDLLQNWK